MKVYMLGISALHEMCSNMRLWSEQPQLSVLLVAFAVRNVQYLFSAHALVQNLVVPRSMSVVGYCLNRITTPGANNSNDEVSTSQHLAP